MNPEALANLFWNTLMAVALLWVVYSVYVKTLRAEFRHELFALRRELFFLMAEGHVQRDDPAYQVLRRLINGLLSRAEEITGLQILIISLVNLRRESKKQTDLQQKLDCALQSKNELRALHQRTNQAIDRHILRLLPISPGLWSGIVLSVVGGIAFALIRHVKKTNRQRSIKPAVTARAVRSPKKIVVRGLTADALGVVQHA